eukprot:1625350-Amphidinium_carterae.1
MCSAGCHQPHHRNISGCGVRRFTINITPKYSSHATTSGLVQLYVSRFCCWEPHGRKKGHQHNDPQCQQHHHDYHFSSSS